MPQHFITADEKQRVEAAIARAEDNCSGEIRVHIAKHCEANVLDSAAHTFAQLGMHRTKLRNGVLFFIAYADHKFAVIGDVGINSKVEPDFWDDVSRTMAEHFRNQQFADGLCAGIELCGQKLKTFFPHEADDVNELPNEISFGK